MEREAGRGRRAGRAARGAVSWVLAATVTLAVAAWPRAAAADVEPAHAAPVVAVVERVGTWGGAEQAAARQLAQRYAPLLMLQAQSEECDPDGEPYAPASVEAVLGNPQVALRQVGDANPVVTWGPTAADLFGLREGFFLDFPGSALEPGCIYERDQRAFTRHLLPTVYAHVVQQPDRPDLLVVQYWFWFYFNDWNNKHEGDWEGIQLVFPAALPSQALKVPPIEVGYSQHSGGERADWDDDKLEREGLRPVVYTSVRSHASYFGAALYLGRNGDEGFGCDDTGGPTVRVDPQVVLLPTVVDDPDSEFAWLAYEGRWGERGQGPYNGPTGPAQKARWTHPVDHQEQLRDGSVVVPAGDRWAAGVAGRFCDLIEWGSNEMVAIKLQPMRGVILAALAIAVLSVALRRTSWRRVEPLPIVRRRRLGEIVRASLRIFAGNPLTFVAVGLVGLPVAVLTGAVASVVQATPLIGDLLALGGGVSSVGMSLILSGVASLVGFVAVGALVAWLAGEAEVGRRPGAAEAVRAVRGRASDLAGGLGRAVGVVGALTLSLVGLPWAVRQVFRYQFFTQATVLEGAGPERALARSSELVRGRWGHTMFVVGAIHALLGALAGVVGLVLLVAVRPPFWVLSGTMVLVEVVAYPLAAIVLTLLYGDAVAERDGVAAAAPDELVAAGQLRPDGAPG